MQEFRSNLKSKNPEVSGEFTCGSRSKDTNNICMCKAFYIKLNIKTTKQIEKKNPTILAERVF